MAVAMFLTFRASVTTYDRVLRGLEWDVTPPIGGIVHLAAVTPDGIEVCEIWQTRDTAEAFVRDVLEPTLDRLGVRAEMDHAIFPLHNLYVPDLETIERIGTVSLPGVAAGAIFKR